MTRRHSRTSSRKQQNGLRRTALLVDNALSRFISPQINFRYDSIVLTGKEEFDDKQKEVEKVVNPIMSKLYAAGGGGAGGSSSGEDEEMPDHDEL